MTTPIDAHHLPTHTYIPENPDGPGSVGEVREFIPDCWWTEETEEEEEACRDRG